MKKKRFWSLLALFAIVGSAMTLTSCFGDDDKEPENPDYIKTMIIDYHVELSQSWYTYYDIDVTYLDDHSNYQTVRITDTWDYHREMSVDKAPKSYSLNVSATPKKNHPEISDDDDFLYYFNENITAKTYNIRYNGSTSNNFNWSDSRINTQTVKAWQLKNYLNEGVRNLFTFNRSWDGRPY